MSKIARIDIDSQSVSANYDIDCSKGDIVIVRLVVTANLSISATNFDVGTEVTLMVKQDADGGNTITINGDFQWVGGSAPTLTTTGNSLDIFKFTSSGTKLMEISRALDVK